MTTLATTAPALDARGAMPRTYHVRTLGCQMNVHDSEHMAGLLEGAAPGGRIPIHGLMDPRALVSPARTTSPRLSLFHST